MFHPLLPACKYLPSERHELLLFWFNILMSHPFYIHMETSVCHPLPSLPSFYLFIVFWNRSFDSLHPPSPRCNFPPLFPIFSAATSPWPWTFSFFPFPLQSVPLLILSVRLLSSCLVVDFGELFVRESFSVVRKNARGATASLFKNLITVIFMNAAPRTMIVVIGFWQAANKTKI